MKTHKQDHFIAIYYGCMAAKPPRSEAVISVEAEGLPPSSVEEQTSTEFNLWPRWITTSEHSDPINFTAAVVKLSLH